MKLSLAARSLVLSLSFVGGLIGFIAPSEAKQHRSRQVTRDFQIEHPCPSTGRQYGACPGWIKDHIRALACGGADSVENMQWQTVEDAKAKDKWELRDCHDVPVRLP